MVLRFLVSLIVFTGPALSHAQDFYSVPLQVATPGTTFAHSFLASSRVDALYLVEVESEDGLQVFHEKEVPLSPDKAVQLNFFVTVPPEYRSRDGLHSITIKLSRYEGRDLHPAIEEKLFFLVDGEINWSEILFPGNGLVARPIVVENSSDQVADYDLRLTNLSGHLLSGDSHMGTSRITLAPQERTVVLAAFNEEDVLRGVEFQIESQRSSGSTVSTLSPPYSLKKQEVLGEAGTPISMVFLDESNISPIHLNHNAATPFNVIGAYSRLTTVGFALQMMSIDREVELEKLEVSLSNDLLQVSMGRNPSTLDLPQAYQISNFDGLAMAFNDGGLQIGAIFGLEEPSNIGGSYSSTEGETEGTPFAYGSLALDSQVGRFYVARNTDLANHEGTTYAGYNRTLQVGDEVYFSPRLAVVLPDKLPGTFSFGKTLQFLLAANMPAMIDTNIDLTKNYLSVSHRFDADLNTFRVLVSHRFTKSTYLTGVVPDDDEQSSEDGSQEDPGDDSQDDPGDTPEDENEDESDNDDPADPVDPEEPIQVFSQGGTVQEVTTRSRELQIDLLVPVTDELSGRMGYAWVWSDDVLTRQVASAGVSYVDGQHEFSLEATIAKDVVSDESSQWQLSSLSAFVSYLQPDEWATLGFSWENGYYGRIWSVYLTGATYLVFPDGGEMFYNLSYTQQSSPYYISYLVGAEVGGQWVLADHHPETTTKLMASTAFSHELTTKTNAFTFRLGLNILRTQLKNEESTEDELNKD